MSITMPSRVLDRPHPGPAWGHCIGPPSKLPVSASMCCLKGDMPKRIHSLMTLMDTWHCKMLTIFEYIIFIYIYLIILSISIDSQFNALLSLLRGPHGSLCYNLFGIEYVRAFGLCLLCLSLQRSTIPKSTLHIWHPRSTYSVNQKIMQQRSIERFKDWIKAGSKSDFPTCDRGREQHHNPKWGQEI